MHEELTTTLKKLLVSDLFVDLPEEQIGVDDGLQSVIGLDSVGFLELRVICEERFGVEISDADFSAANFRTLNQLAELITRLKSAKKVKE